jgi:hypothetical protein
LSSSNLLKGFGVGADVVGQLATDKALRRKSTGTTKGFDMTNGALLGSETIKAGVTKPQAFAHGLSREPQAVFLSQPTDASILIDRYDATSVWVDGDDDAVFSLWVV